MHSSAGSPSGKALHKLTAQVTCSHQACRDADVWKVNVTWEGWGLLRSGGFNGLARSL